MKVTLEVVYEPGDEVYHVTSGESKGVVIGFEARKCGSTYRVTYWVAWDDRNQSEHCAEELQDDKPIT